MPTGCNHSMLRVPVWTTEVTVHMARPFKDRLSDAGPARSLLRRPPGEDYHRECFLFRLLILKEEYRGCLEGTDPFAPSPYVPEVLSHIELQVIQGILQHFPPSTPIYPSINPSCFPRLFSLL